MADSRSSLVVERGDGLVLSDDPARLDLGRICGWLATSYWAADRAPDLVERSIANSRNYGVYAPGGEQIAFARAVTDDASFAWLADVIVDEAWRGRGVGRWMVGLAVHHLRGLGVPRFVLGTRDAHGVYAALGFEPLRIPELWMEIDDRSRRPTRSDVRLAGDQPLAREKDGNGA